MKKTILIISTLCSLGSMLFTGCKKDSNPTPSTTTSTADVESDKSANTNSMDINNSTSASNQAQDDANTMAASSSSGRIDATIFCGLSVVDTTMISVSGTNKKMIKYTYDGTSHCGKGTWNRSGTILITLEKGDHFSDVGAMWTISFAGYKYGTSATDTNSIQFDGTHTIVNVSGGLPRWVWRPFATNPVIHKVRSSNMKITYSDGTSRDWSVARKLTYAFTTGEGYSLTETGDTTINGTSGVSIWGTNRFGYTFTTQILTPIVTSSSCWWYASQGERKHVIVDAADGKSITVDEAISTNSNTGCADGYKLTYTRANGTVRVLTVGW